MKKLATPYFGVLLHARTRSHGAGLRLVRGGGMAEESMALLQKRQLRRCPPGVDYDFFLALI